MPRYDFAAPRLFVEAPLAAGTSVLLNADQVNYLRAVLRMPEGGRVLTFNGHDGEWIGAIAASSRKSWDLRIIEQCRPQPAAAQLRFLFAPLKHARLDYMAQKAVEMGASHLHPVLTRRTQIRSVNLARLRANAIEAAEQCGVLHIPEIAAPRALHEVLADWPAGRLLAFCDEDAQVADPVAVLRGAAAYEELAILVGPEGGFAPEEREALRRLPQARVISLGPRILRADTAAVAALAVLQTALGDWR